MWTIRVLVLAVVLCGGVPWGVVCAPAANPIDAAAMQAIAKSIGWAVQFSSDPCTWAGVSCNEVGRVTSIVASHAGLQGDLHGEDLSKLTFLSNLDLSFNGLSGKLPGLPTPLQYLRTIDLGSNSFFGIHDGFFAGLPALETIVLDNNDLTMAWIEQADAVPCSRLRSFSANNASFKFDFPNFFGDITLFPDLERLSLARNHLEGIVLPGFGVNSKISHLDIGRQTQNGDYKINGRMDLFIPNMVNLVEAHLDHNGFTGLVPDATQLVNLRVFDASYNDLCGVPKFPAGTAVDLAGNPRVGGGC
uniref:Uncharacterized protein n=1 Tax=Avena sativa TaxID=4498 RepID=A0ACD5XAS0_AVESA